MKHLKNFGQLNESREDGVSIMDAVANSPEGKDLCVILKADPANLGHWFEMVRTGRIYVRGAGSKTYMGRYEDGRFYYESVSNGKPFGTEYFPDIKSLLRGLWLNLAGKWSTHLGLSKKDFMQWVDENIQPGRGLSIHDLREDYIKSNGKDLPDVAEILKSPKLEFFKKIYFSSYRISDAREESNITIHFEPWNPIGILNGFGFTQERASASVRAKVSDKKSSMSANFNSCEIYITRSASALSDFEKYLDKFLGELLIRIPNKIPDEYRDFIHSIIETIISGSSTQDNSEKVETLLSALSQEDPIQFSKVIVSMDGAGVFPEIVQHFKDSSGKLIKGGKLLGSLGF